MGLLLSLTRRAVTAGAKRAIRHRQAKRDQFGTGGGPLEEGRPGGRSRGTVDGADVARFGKLAGDWWDPSGPHAPLHRFVPVRMALIRAHLAPLAESGDARRPLTGLRVLDIGCGGGLLSEPMTRLGATVVGVDADAAGIAAARAHAEATGLSIDYRHAAIEDLAAAGERFNAVVASEVIEHVADRPAFLDAIGTLLRPGGGLVLTTINRTPRSFAVAIVAAEYVLRMIPRGTHDWNQFPKPEELRGLLESRGFEVDPPIGFHYDVLDGTFEETADTRVNYGLTALKG